MVTIQLDMAYDAFPRDLVDGEDATDIAPVYNGIAPDKLIVVQALGPGGGNPDCLVSFNDEKNARAWFSYFSGDDDPTWFDENVV